MAIFSGKYTFVPRFLQLSSINVLANLMVPLAGLIDVAFLGHLADLRHLAGVALATVLFNYIYWTFGFLRMGTTGMTAQAVGRGNDQEVILVGLRNSLLALSLGLGILLLQYPLRELGFALLSASAPVKASGESFYNALIWGAPATLINFVFIGWFLGQEQGRKVFLLSLVSNGANVVLDYLFIGQWGWESAGAGAATAMSQYLMLVVGLLLVAYKYRHAGMTPKLLGDLGKSFWRQVLDSTAIKEAFSLNRDILVRTLVMMSAFAAFINLSSALGLTILATNTLLMQIVTLAAYFIDGIAFATESFAGMFYGQELTLGKAPPPETLQAPTPQTKISPAETSQTETQLLPLIWVSGGLSLAWGLTIASLVALFPLPLFSLLTKHLEVVNQTPVYAFWLLPVLGFGSLAYMLDGYFIGLTAGRVLLRSAIFASFAGFAPVAILAWYRQSPHLLWLALTLFMAGRAIILAIAVPPTLASSNPP